MSYLRAQDTFSGSEGRITFNMNGKIEFGGYVKKIDATFEKKKVDIKVLGRRNVQHKPAGWNGKGSCSLYYITSSFRALANNYAKTGRDVFFDVTIENTDPASNANRQTVILRNCNLDNVTLAKLDVSSEVLDEDMSFTFDDFDIIRSFRNIM